MMQCFNTTNHLFVLNGLNSTNFEQTQLLKRKYQNYSEA